jgi:hypothetical protein
MILTKMVVLRLAKSSGELSASGLAQSGRVTWRTITNLLAWNVRDLFVARNPNDGRRVPIAFASGAFAFYL